MSDDQSRDELTSLVVRSTTELDARESLITRGLKDITCALQAGSVTAFVDRGLALFVEERLDEAIAVCDAGLKIDQKDECLWQIKGVSLAKQGKYSEGLNCLTEALAIDDQNPHLWVLKAKLLRHDSYRAEDEMDCWRRVIQISPVFNGAWREIGNCLVHLGRYKEAVHAFDSELGLNPSDSDCIRQKAAVLWDLARD
jgi:tetratricopeptide (TPR) repeat protein